MVDARPSFVPFTSDDTTEEYHELISSILPQEESDDGPVLRAAGSELTALQSLYQQAAALSDRDRDDLVTNYEVLEYVDARWDSTLLHAIRSRRLENVAFLLGRGANPNGISLASQEAYAKRFRRFLTEGCDPTDTVVPILPEDLEEISSAQLSALTDEDMSARSDGIAVFWGPPRPRALPLDLSRNGDQLHSLIAASSNGSIELYDTIADAGADSSFWRSPLATQLPSSATPSSLCLSTPLHAAISKGDKAMLQHIIEMHGLSPNSRALAANDQAWTPLQKALLDNQPEALQYLQAHPGTDLKITTPVYGIHILHLAAAKFDIDFLRSWNTPPAPAPLTALGQTPLHNACLPLTDLHLALYSPPIRASIHDVRTLDPRWEIHQPRQFHFGVRTQNPEYPDPSIPDDHAGQDATVKQLVEMFGVAEIRKQDIYGNTGLHYLAAAKCLNEGLVFWMKGCDGAGECWVGVRNRWGHTAEDLWKAGRKTGTGGAVMGET